MPTNFDPSNALDLDDVFDPYESGMKPALTGYVTSTGQDLRDRYNPISEGDQALATTMCIAGGADLNTLFAAKGTSSKVIDPPGFDGGAYTVDRASTHDISAGILFYIKRDGTFAIVGNPGGPISTNSHPLFGDWHKEPAATCGDAYQVSFNGTTYNTINADRSYGITVFASTGDPYDSYKEQSASVNVYFRKVGGTSVKHFTLTLHVSASAGT